MRIISLVAVSLAAIAAQAQDGWKNPKTVFATFVEKYGEGPEKKLDLLQKDGQISYRTSSSINGELDGVRRIESVGTAGAFTWIEGKPETALQLMQPTLAGADEYFVRPRFSRADLEFNVAGIEKALRTKVYIGKQEQIAGRDCLVLRVAAAAETSNSDFQKLWIDRETGLTMKQQDSFNGKITYERTVSSIEFKETADAAAFTMPASAVVIKGLVSPLTLVRTGNLGGVSDFRADIERINNSVKDPQKPWAGAFDYYLDMGYAQTSSRDFRVMSVNVNPFANNNNNNNRNNQRRRNQFGRGEHGNGEQTFSFELAGSDGGQVRIARAVRIERADIALIAPDPPQNSSAAQGSNAGAIGGAGGANGANGGGTTGASSKTYPFAQSDFVDPKSGDTLSLLQISGRAIEPAFAGLILAPAKALESEKPLESVKVYTTTAPMKLTILVWKSGDVNYALASSNLDQSDLVAIAKKVKKVQ